MQIAVIADIIGSRRLPDRDHAQRDLDDTIAGVHAHFPLALDPLHPTVGDEQQATYPTLDAALTSLLLLRLALPEGIECRFGVGVGDLEVVRTAAGSIPEGPGWWAARDAIEIVHGLQKRTAPSARTWVAAAAGHDAAMAQTVRLANAYALSRDHVVGAMSARARRLTYGRCRGQTQADLARAEGISQSAVSQALATAGAGSIIEGLAQLAREVRT
ncbi:SatD family protein [Microbacterium sp. NPDC055910]|uniref:SatD family protein n=1 Tax=Microbacterium sp. NPDC055910 TaxID=3345659 RepID=UPI0035E1330C